MSGSTADQLKRAYAHIKAGDNKSAIGIIRPILQQDKDNAGGWWLLANAIDNPTHQEKALEHVLRLKPGEAKAQQMLTRIRSGSTVPMPEPVREPEPVSHTTYDDDPFDDDPFNDDPFDDAADPFAEDDSFATSTYTPAHDDPFGGQDPFGNDGASSYSPNDDPFGGVQTGNAKQGVSVRKASGGNSNIGKALVAVMVVGLVGVVGIIVFMVIGNMPPSSSGNCDVGTQNRGAVTTVQCAEIATDQLWTGRLNLNEQHVWSFNGNAGQQIRIDAIGTGDITTDTVLTLIDPSGRQLAQSDDVDTLNSNLDSRISTQLPASGTYSIRVNAFNFGDGGYEIWVRDDTQSVDSAHCDANSSSQRVPCGAIARGQDRTGRLDASEYHAWTFEANEGQRIRIRLDETDGGDMYLELYNRSGTLIAADDDIDFARGNLNAELNLTLTGSGVYTIVVQTWGGYEAASYRLELD